MPPHPLRTNPYESPAPIEPGESIVADPIAVPPSWVDRFASVLTQWMIIGTIPAAAIACFEIKSIVISGLTLTTAALVVLAIVAMRRRWNTFLFPVALATLLFTVACFLTINLNRWYPAEATKPISRACVVFALVMQGAWILKFRELKTGRQAT